MDPFKALSQLASGELRGMRDSDLLLVTLAYLRELDQPHWPHSQPPIGAAWGALRQLPAEQLPDALARATAPASRLGSRTLPRRPAANRLARCERVRVAARDDRPRQAP